MRNRRVTQYLATQQARKFYRGVAEWTIGFILAVGMLAVCAGLVCATFSSWEARIAQIQAEHAR